jgi:hypothetical protein
MKLKKQDRKTTARVDQAPISPDRADLLEACQALAMALWILDDEGFDKYQGMRRKAFMHRLSMTPAERTAFDSACFDSNWMERYDTPSKY